MDEKPQRLLLEVLGEVPFEAGVARMRELAEQRARGEGEDTLLLMSHPEVLSVGRRRGAHANILISEIPVVEVDRGGDVTWHGPGQIVGYPVLRLQAHERDVHAVLRRLEGGLIALLTALELPAKRSPPHTGVWVEEAPHGRLKKVCSIGLGVRAWVAMHGFSLNVDNDLARFAAIRPCGLDHEVMGSLVSLGVDAARLYGLETQLHWHLAQAFEREAVGEAAPPV